MSYMNKFFAPLITILIAFSLAACGKKETAPAEPATPAAQTAPAETAATAPSAEPAQQTEESASAAANAAASAPAEEISETDDGAGAAAGEGTPTAQNTAAVQPSLRLGGQAQTSPTSSQFKEGKNYQKVVPAQPTGVAPDKVEVIEAFWYGCGHCFQIDPAVESWRGKGRAPYVEFVRVPAMWNENTRMHARVFYTAELLGKLDTLHPLIFREIHVNNNPLNSVDRIAAFFEQQGVSRDEFKKAFSSFAVESKLQRADFLNRRYRVQSVPTVIVNGKYTTDVGQAGGEPQLFTLINELAAHEHGG
jgi:protein dithiol oxidoreductase (disulfide-forming)